MRTLSSKSFPGQSIKNFPLENILSCDMTDVKVVSVVYTCVVCYCHFWRVFDVGVLAGDLLELLQIRW